MDDNVGAYLEPLADCYRAVFEQIAEGVFLFDAASKRILDANPALCDLLGYSGGELRALTLYDIIAHDRPSIDTNIGKIVADGRNPIGERLYRCKDGRLVAVEVGATMVRLPDGRTILAAVVRDLTARKLAEAERAASEAQMRAILAGLPVIVFALDADETITFAAGQGLATLHLVPERIIGLPLRTMSRNPAVVSYIRRALRGETFSAIVGVHDRLFSTRYAPVRDDLGVIDGVIGVALDVTDQTEAQARLARVDAGLSEREEAVLALLTDPHLSARQIGDHLSIGRATVYTHQERIAAKLGVEPKRATIIAFAQEHGLIDRPVSE